MNLRKHQKKLQSLLFESEESRLPMRILAWVVPGGGKSILPCLVKKRFPKLKIGWFVPRLSLQRQAVESASINFGFELRDSGNDINPSREGDGFVATTQSLISNPELWEHEFNRNNYILVIDELHHAKLARNGEPEALARAISRLRYSFRLDMTGTLETGDGCKISDIEYSMSSAGETIEENPKGYKIIRYTRQDALNDSAIVPIKFHHLDAKLNYINSGNEFNITMSAAEKDQESAAIFTALNTEYADRLFADGVEHWQNCGRKMIVVAQSQKAAEKYHQKLCDMGISAALAITDNDEAHEDVQRFRGAKDPEKDAMVTCQMAYEGLDAPDTTHIVCLTNIRSSPWIEQMLGRAWRSAGGKTMCHAFVPDDPRMARVIEQLRRDVPPMVVEYNEREQSSSGAQQLGTIAIAGEATDEWSQSLDCDPLSSACLADATDFIQRYVGRSPRGLAEQISEMVLTYNLNQKNDLQKLTVKERETNLRKQIADACRQKDRNRGVDFGTHQKKLIRIMRKSITEMSERELKNAAAALSRI